MQRAECINEALQDILWRNRHNCLAAAKTDFGRAVIDDKTEESFPATDQGQRIVAIGFSHRSAIRLVSVSLRR